MEANQYQATRSRDCLGGGGGVWARDLVVVGCSGLAGFSRVC